MFFSGETLQSRIWKLITNYKKTVIVILSVIFSGFIAILATNLQGSYIKGEAVQVILECQDLEKNKKYNEAYDKLQKIYVNYDSLISKNIKFKNLVDLYNYKLGLLSNNVANAEKKIIETKYISQWYTYEDFSIAGELVLIKKMDINFQHKQFLECANTYMSHKMQKLPHFVAGLYRAEALKNLNNKTNAKDFLTQMLLYCHDYSGGQFKELIKNLLFQS